MIRNRSESLSPQISPGGRVIPQGEHPMAQQRKPPLASRRDRRRDVANAHGCGERSSEDGDDRRPAREALAQPDH